MSLNVLKKLALEGTFYEEQLKGGVKSIYDNIDSDLLFEQWYEEWKLG